MTSFNAFQEIIDRLTKPPQRPACVITLCLCGETNNGPRRQDGDTVVFSIAVFFGFSLVLFFSSEPLLRSTEHIDPQKSEILRSQRSSEHIDLQKSEIFRSQRSLEVSQFVFTVDSLQTWLFVIMIIVL